VTAFELSPHPIEQLHLWYGEAERVVPHADVVALATANAAAMPSVRMVNFKGWRGESLIFFTNYESRKGCELKANARAAMLFYWPALKRQVQVEGACSWMTTADSQSYFMTREREVQLSTLMSQQSRELSSFDDMKRRVDELRKEYAHREIPCPSYWGGVLLYPQRLSSASVANIAGTFAGSLSGWAAAGGSASSFPRAVGIPFLDTAAKYTSPNQI
jgi:pyridoxamine 5'-phosphate oxidase